MKRIIVFLTVILLSGMLFGCELINGKNGNSNNNSKNNNNSNNNNKIGKEEPRPQVLQIKDYSPVKENRRYIYEGVGNEYASYDITTDYIDGDKFQQRVNNGGTVMANVFEIKNGKLVKVYSRGESYYRENFLKAKDVKEDIMLMEPLKMGTTWKSRDLRVRTITNMAVDITTPTGNYKAIEVTTESEDGKNMDYYAKDVGLVKSVFISGGNEISSTLSKIEENVPLIQNINFYYPNIEDGKIYYKRRDISFKTNEITRKVLAEAYKEAANDQLGIIFSKNTEINSLYLNNDQYVYIDLNQKFIDEMNAGSGVESMILQSIANTFGSYYNSERVYLTIDSKPYESGHFSMKKGEYFKVQLQGTLELQ